MDTCAHVMPGMQPDAAELFIRLVFDGDNGHQETDEAPTATPEQDPDETLEDDE